MAIVQSNNNNENSQKISLPRRIATYITSMNFAKVFRRHHHHQQPPREISSPIPKISDKPSVTPHHHHHQYSRPFSYHIPANEQLLSPSLIKTSNVVPYRIGLSSDSTLLNNNQTNENDDIVRLPSKNLRSQSPKIRKDRRYQSQLNANKRWLYRSMETLDGWKGKVFPTKTRPTNSSPTRSRSVEDLIDENMLTKSNPSLNKQRAISPNRSIEAITNRVINGIGIHRKSANSVPNITRSSPAITIKKQSLFPHFENHSNGKLKSYNNNNNKNSSTILDFREISSLGFSQSNILEENLQDDNEDTSLPPSENVNHDEDEDIISNLSVFGNGYEHNHDIDNETTDPWDFSITWIDSLKEQHSPQRKIQFYENLIQLLEQDTLNIDELLVLRKVLAKIWPIDDPTSSTITDFNNQISSIDSKTNSTKSLPSSNKIKQRSKLSTMTQHTAQRCSTVIEQTAPFVYEPLHEHNSGHHRKSTNGLLAAKAKPCFIDNNSNKNEPLPIEQNYPQHLNPFNDDVDIIPSAPQEETNDKNNDSIRRYFERLTLLETIYEKLNRESNKTPVEPSSNQQLLIPANPVPSSLEQYQPIEKRMELKKHSPTKCGETSKPIANKFVEMNVDGNGSISSAKSSLKRRAPRAPHKSQTNNNNNPTMFTLSPTDVDIPPKLDREINIPIRFQTSDEKSSKEKSIHNNTTASCDEDGQIFVYDANLNLNNEESQITTLPRKTERIQQWLSLCDTKEDTPIPQNISPNNQFKMRCIAKPIRHSSPSPQHIPSPITNNELEPGRFRSCLKIHLETNDSINHRSRASSETPKYHQQQQQPTNLNDDFNVTEEEEYYQQNTLSPSFQRDRQSVYL